MIQRVSIFHLELLFNDKNDKLDQKLSFVAHSIYLAEDCYFSPAREFRKGKKLTLQVVEYLKKFGFNFIWISDEPMSDKESIKKMYYQLKIELTLALNRLPDTIDESKIKRSNISLIKHIQRNDLIRISLGALESQGAFSVMQQLFGHDLSELRKISFLIQKYYRTIENNVLFFPHISLGNLYQEYQQNNVSNIEKSGKSNKIPSNFCIQKMIHMMLIFMVSINRIQKKRASQDLETRKVLIQQGRRFLYEHKEIVEGALASLFCEHGMMYLPIRNLILRNTHSFMNEYGQLTENSYVTLSEQGQQIYDKHCYVESHLFESVKSFQFISSLAVNILRYHHTGLDGQGYPKRRRIQAINYSKDSENKLEINKQEMFADEISEMTRLSCIINFLVDMISLSPLHLPFNRHDVVEHLIKQSILPLEDKTKKLDVNGVFDFNTKDVHPGFFDRYLVFCVLESVHLYAIGEKIILRYKHHPDLKKEVVVIQYNNNMPHRPIVELCDSSKSQINLSNPENQYYYLDECIPTGNLDDFTKHIAAPVKKKNKRF